jgi:hypothetical protein
MAARKYYTRETGASHNLDLRMKPRGLHHEIQHNHRRPILFKCYINAMYPHGHPEDLDRVSVHRIVIDAASCTNTETSAALKVRKRSSTQSVVIGLMSHAADGACTLNDETLRLWWEYGEGVDGSQALEAIVNEHPNDDSIHTSCAW